MRGLSPMRNLDSRNRRVGSCVELSWPRGRPREGSLCKQDTHIGERTSSPMSQVTLRQPSKQYKRCTPWRERRRFLSVFGRTRLLPRLPDATELGEENVTKISRNVGDADHHVSLALPSAVSGLAAKMRMTSVHVHTPSAPRVAARTRTLCVPSRAPSFASSRRASTRAAREIAPARRACASPTPPARDRGFRPGFVGGDAGAVGGARGRLRRTSRSLGPHLLAQKIAHGDRQASQTLRRVESPRVAHAERPTTIRRRRSSTGTPLTSQLFMMAKHAAVGRSDVTATTPQDDEAKPNVSMVVTCGKAPS